MLTIALIIGIFISGIVGRITTLAVRLGEPPQHEDTTFLGVVWNILSLPAFLGILFLGFIEFQWWSWLAIVVAAFVTANFGVSGNNYGIGRKLLPILNFLAVASCVTAFFVWFYA